MDLLCRECVGTGTVMCLVGDPEYGDYDETHCNRCRGTGLAKYTYQPSRVQNTKRIDVIELALQTLEKLKNDRIKSNW